MFFPLLFSNSTHNDGNSFVERSDLTIILSCRFSSIRHIILVTSLNFSFFCTNVLKPWILKSSSTLTAYVSVSTRKIIFNEFLWASDLSSSSLIISPLRIFQQHIFTSFCLFASFFFSTDFSVSIGTGSTDFGLPIGFVFGFLVAVLLGLGGAGPRGGLGCFEGRTPGVLSPWRSIFP